MALKGFVDIGLQQITDPQDLGQWANALKGLTTTEQKLGKATAKRMGLDKLDLNVIQALIDGNYDLSQAKIKLLINSQDELGFDKKKALSQIEEINQIDALSDKTKYYTAEQLKSILVAGGMSDANADLALSQMGVGSATTITTASIDAYVASILAAIKATLTWLATNPVGWLILVGAAVAGVIGVIALYRESIHNAATESRQGFEDMKGEVDSLNGELETLKEKIKALEAQDSLSIIEQDELSKLKEQNEELERQLAIKEKLLEISQTQAEQDSIKELNLADQTSTEAIGSSGYNRTVNQGVKSITGIEKLQEYTRALDDLKSKEAELQKQQEALGLDAVGSAEWEKYENQLETVRGYIESTEQSFSNLYDKVEGQIAGVTGVTEKGKQILGLFDSIGDWFIKYSNPNTSLQDFIDDSSYSAIIDKLRGIKNAAELSGKAIGDSFSDQYIWQQFVNELEEAGYSVEELWRALNELDNTSVSPEVDPSVILTLEELNTQIDDLQSAYQTLDGVITDYNKTGYLTFDNMQALLGLGNEYLQYLTMENGQLSINTNGMLALASARIDDAEATYVQQAADLITKMMNEGSAAAYLASELSNLSGARLEDANAAYQEAYANAIASGSAEIVSATKQLGSTVNNTRKIFDQMRSSLGSYGSAMLGAASATSSAASTISSALSSINSLLSTTMAMLKQQYSDAADAQKEALNAEKEAVQDRYDAEKEAIESARDAAKERYDAQKQRLEDERDAYNDLIDAQIELLERQKEADDYNKNLAGKQKAVSDVENQLAAISNDDSVEAQKKRLELQQELADAKEELDELQSDREYNLNKQALEDEKDRYDKETEVKLDAIEAIADATDKAYEKRLDQIDKAKERALDAIQAELDAVSDATKTEAELRAEALALMEEGSDEYYQQLLAYNKAYGSGIDADITLQWEKAYTAINSYRREGESILDLMNRLTLEADKAGGAGGGAFNTMADAAANAKEVIRATIEALRTNLSTALREGDIGMAQACRNAIIAIENVKDIGDADITALLTTMQAALNAGDVSTVQTCTNILNSFGDLQSQGGQQFANLWNQYITGVATGDAATETMALNAIAHFMDMQNALAGINAELAYLAKFDFEDVRGEIRALEAEAKQTGGGSYANGGVVAYTGSAQVHGSASNPEVVFNAKAASKLYDYVMNTPSLIGNMLGSITAKTSSGLKDVAQINNSESAITAGDVNIVINGNADSNTVAGLRDAASGIEDRVLAKINALLSNRGYGRKPKTV